MIPIFLHVAQQCEAKPIIKHFHLRRYKHHSPFPIYLSDQYTLVVSGEGKLNTAAAVAYLASHFLNATISPWLNIGVVPTLNEIVAHKVIDRATANVWYPPQLFSWEHTTTLITLDSSPLPPSTDTFCYDLEAAAFFHTANKFSPLEIIQSLKVAETTQKALPAIRDLTIHLTTLATELTQ